MTEQKSMLLVYWKRELVGRLWRSDGNHIHFAYDPSWVAAKKPMISFSMPVREDVYHKEAQSFFGNLLPEGDFRRKIEQVFKVSSDNDFSLIKEIGGDCAGALSIGNHETDDEEAYYETVSEEMLARIVKTEGVAGFGQAGQFNRLSLAGAQGKLPVRVNGQRIEIPHKGAASTHILKFNHQTGEYPALVENEYYMNRVAHHVGLKVVNCHLMANSHGTILVIERYDRTYDAWPERFHQEDFCQALGYFHSNKYEKEGGPSFSNCVNFVRDNLGILAVNSLIDWYLFNLLMGNSDAHGKNISLIHGQNAHTLAPFYDLICTRAYERLDRKLAMACGRQFDPDLIGVDDLRDLAQETGVTFRFMRSRIQRVWERVHTAMDQAKNDLEAQGLDAKLIQQVEQTLQKIHRGFAKRLGL